MALKDKVIDKIDEAYQGPLKKTKLANLTFGDLKVFGVQIEKMRKFAKANHKLKAWDRMSCGACFPKYH
jgi:hypothetical protein